MMISDSALLTWATLYETTQHCGGNSISMHLLRITIHLGVRNVATLSSRRCDIGGKI